MPRLLADLTPLRTSPEFRRLWWGLSLANAGSQMTIIAVQLQVYQITGSTVAVGGIGLAALIPTVIMGLYGGALLDAFDRRKVALIASVIVWCATIGIVVQAFCHVGSLPLLYGLLAVQSGATAVNSPARSAIIPRLVPAAQLPAANALNTLTFNFALMVGPVIGAFLVSTVGYGWTYSVDMCTFTAALYAIYRLPPQPPLTVGGTVADAGASAEKPARGWRSVAEGFVYLATRRNILMTFLCDMCAMIFAYPRVLFPAVGAVMIGGGDRTTGWLTAAMAVGSTLAGVFSGPLGRVRRQGRAVWIAVSIYGLAVTGFGAVLVAVGHTHPAHIIWPAMIAAMAALAVAGMADAISAVFRGTILQVAAPDNLRGRLQGVFTVVVTGGPRLGEMVGGGAAGLIGEGGAAVAGGLVCAAALAVLMRWHRPFLRYDAKHPVA
ncbi:MAG: MFS transporter [Bifidobacteriaceae bacterium]|nr:MFS transporter [Bifidobacteriaceae bacterium]